MYPNKPFIVAEMSCNHGGSLHKAQKLVEFAADAGCDAIKLQTWRTMTMDNTPLKSGPWAGKSLVDLYEECKTPWEWHKPLFLTAKDNGIECFSTPFDVESVDFLESLGVERYKVASFEITDLHLIKYIAEKKKPMIISTGAAYFQEIRAAKEAIGKTPATFMYCSSKYPSEAKDVCLGMRYPTPSWGFSDHTLGYGCAAAACAFGADVIEKHLTISRSDPTPDAGFSLEPEEMCQFVQVCRDSAEAARYKQKDDFESQIYRRSVYATRNIKAGKELTFHNVRTLRPLAEGGIPANNYESVLGKIAKRDIQAGPLQVSDF